MNGDKTVMEMVQEHSPELIARLREAFEEERTQVNAAADDSVLLMVRDVRFHWKDGDCDGDKSCLGGALNHWTQHASPEEVAVVLGRAIALLADVLPDDANHTAATTAAESRDQKRERERDSVADTARASLGSDTAAALVIGPFEHGETPDLGSILRGVIGS